MIYSTAVTGLYNIRLPQWGRCFWQDPDGGTLFLAYASGDNEVDFITSSDSGNTWSNPTFMFPVDNFSNHNNFDIIMDRRSGIHAGFRFNASGCYQYFGKSGNTWTPSAGIGAPLGMVTAGDSGIAPGFQGSMSIQENRYFSEPNSINYPATRYVAKDSGNLIRMILIGNDHQDPTDVEEISWRFGYVNFGTDGGYPITYNYAGPEALGTYTPGFSAWHEPYSYIWRYTTAALGIEAQNIWYVSSATNDIAPHYNMAIGSGGGIFKDGTRIVFGDVGQSFYQNITFGWRTSESRVISNGTENYWKGKAGYEHGDPNQFMQRSGIVPTGNLWGVGPTSGFIFKGGNNYDFPGKGSRVDFSFNDDGDYIFYYQTKDEDGKQCIGRFVYYFDGVNLDFSNANGNVRYIAQATKDTTGGFNNIPFWGGFKALKHPVEPNPDNPKKEMIVTQGWTLTYPSGSSLTTWDVQESPGMGWPLPVNSIDYTSTSGTSNEIFKGIIAHENFSFTSHVDLLPNLFNDDTSAEARVQDGYVVTIEMDEPREIDRVEIVHRNLGTTSQPALQISGSLDNIHYSPVFWAESGIINAGGSFNDGNSLLRYSCKGRTRVIENQHYPTHIVMDPFIAKYMRLCFRNTHDGTKYIYELKLYGPGTFHPEIVTWSNQTSDPPPFYRTEYIKKNCVEQFHGQEGSLPPGWKTYGDFTWGIVGSGTSTLRNGAPSDTALPPGYDGYVPSGYFNIIGSNLHGNGDGYSLRSWPIADADGVVDPNSPIGASGHSRILPGQSATVEASVYVIDAERRKPFSFDIRTDEHADDLIEVYIYCFGDDNYPERSSPTGQLIWSNTHGAPSDWETIHNSLDYGTNIIRWVYTRGSITWPYVYGCAWIDNIVGLSGAPQPTIRGYTRGSSPYDYSSIYGYLNSKDSMYIHGVIPLVSGPASEIYGYLDGHSGIYNSGMINGYVDVHDSIAESIHGYLQNLAGTGIEENINGFLMGWEQSPAFFRDPQTMIFGYLHCNDTYADNIYGYLSGNAPVDIPYSDKIHGYLDAIESPFKIYGYVDVAAGIYGGIYGYVSAGAASGNIHGYVPVYDIASGVIHGFVKCTPVSETSRKGYTAGITGNYTDNIYGYLDAIGYDNPKIHGYLVCMTTDTDICSNHDFPLQPVPVCVIPTGNFFNY